ncbi:MAG: anti-sigma factor family protein [Bryobacteraceae bacterium]
MSCAPFDLRDYFFGELKEADRALTESHVRGCTGCREELTSLQATRETLLALRDEEIPQRVAFVSDRVYEPSAWKRHWMAFWSSGPRLGFASAALLSVALLAHAYRPAAPVAVAPAVDVSALRAELARDVQTAVVKAVAAADERHKQETSRIVKAVEQRFEAQRLRDVKAMEDELAFMTRRLTSVYRASYLLGDRP